MKLRKIYYTVVLVLVAATAYIVNTEKQIPTKIVDTALTTTGKGFEVNFLDVGQGNCVLVKYPNGEYMLVDCGSTSGAPTNIKETLPVEVKKIMGDKNFHTVVITHADKDHYSLIPFLWDKANNPENLIIGGKIEYYSKSKYITDMQKGGANIITYEKNYASLSKEDKSTGIEADAFAETTFPQMDNVETYILSANQGKEEDKNSDSIVLLLRHDDNLAPSGGGAAGGGGGSGGTQGSITAYNIVLTGDASSVVEDSIVSTWNDYEDLFTNNKVLLLGHHGSDSSTSRNFIEFIKPRHVFFSTSGKHRQYFHPRCSVVNIIEGFGTSILPSKEHYLTCGCSAKQQFVTFKTQQSIHSTANQKSISVKIDANSKTLVEYSADIFPASAISDVLADYCDFSKEILKTRLAILH